MALGRELGANMLFQTALMTTLGLIALVVIIIDAISMRRKSRKAK